MDEEDPRFKRALGTEKTLPPECVVELPPDFTFQDVLEAVQKGKAALLEHGVLQIKKILRPEYVAEFHRLFQNYYEETSRRTPDGGWEPPKMEGESEADYQRRLVDYLGYRFDEPSTHTKSALVALHRILKQDGIGVSEPMCYLRTLDPVVWLFSAIHGTDDLFTSHDGVSYYHFDRENFKTPPLEPSTSWLHQDLNPELGAMGSEGKFFGLQCQFTMPRHNAPGYHLRAVLGSHLKDYRHLGEVKGHWFKPVDSDGNPPEGFTKPGSVVVKTEGEEGDAILWFSNTIHSGSQLPTDANRTRLTAYVCMHPKKHIWDQKNGRYFTLDRKRFDQIYEEAATTDHWGRKKNARKTQHRGNPLMDNTFLMPREHGWKIFLRTATPEQKRRLDIFRFKSGEGLMGGYKGEPVVKILSLQEGKALVQAEKKRSAPELNPESPSKVQRV